jgi:hypothetical protein
MKIHRLVLTTLWLWCIPIAARAGSIGLLLTPHAGQPDSYAISTISYPGASPTTVTDINNVGQVIGHYQLSCTSYNFIYDGSNYTTIGSYSADYINDNGDLAGNYFDGTWHGFIIVGGITTTIDYPGAGFTLINDINNNGDAAGLYAPSQGSYDQHGFIYQNEFFSSVDFPPYSTGVWGINDNGDTIGSISDYSGSSTHGFLFSHGVLTTLQYPGFLFNTWALAMNNLGAVLGQYADSTNRRYDFLFQSEIYTLIDFPIENSSGATIASLESMNDAGYIVDNRYTPDSYLVLEPSRLSFLVLGIFGLAGLRKKRK